MAALSYGALLGMSRSNTRTRHRHSTCLSAPQWRESTLTVTRPCRSRTTVHVKASTAGQITQSTCTVPSGLRLEVLSHAPEKTSLSRPELVFVHGSYHAAWCWAMYWMPYFASRGYPCHALSLRGQGRGDHIQATPTLDQHTAAALMSAEGVCMAADTPDTPHGSWALTSAVKGATQQDVAHFVGTLSGPTVLVGHSFGGILVQRYISGQAPIDCPAVAGAVMACSVPPYGNGPMVTRFLLSKPLASLRLTWSLAARGWDGNLGLFRESFFSEALPEATLMRFMELMSANSRGRLLDLKDLNKQLPIGTTPPGSPPVMVMGGTADFCVDVKGIQDTAELYGVKPVLLEHMPHDVMLDVEWKQAAEAVADWLDAQQL